MINFKISRTAIEIASLDKNNLFLRHNHVHDHMIHVIEIHIVTGHEEMGNLHFILKVIFHYVFIEKTCICSKFIQLDMKL